MFADHKEGCLCHELSTGQCSGSTISTVNMIAIMISRNRLPDSEMTHYIASTMVEAQDQKTRTRPALGECRKKAPPEVFFLSVSDCAMRR
jgi:hypothetical protein